MLLWVLSSRRSERQLAEQVQDNLLFRWFAGLAADDTFWVPTDFTKSRQRLTERDVVIKASNGTALGKPMAEVA